MANEANSAAGAARRIASVLAPEPLKRRHEAWSTGRFLKRANALNRVYAEEHGLTVKRGPFCGLTYPAAFMADSGDVVAKMLGLYEAELTGVFEEWIAAGFERIIDVGSAEGYFAVGLALASPGTTVYAFDVNPEARERCSQLAELNGVADRVQVRGRCGPAELRELVAGRTGVLVDCEGCETMVLDPEAAPVLSQCDVLVELHDFIDPAISSIVLPRFEETHDVTLIDARGRDDTYAPELDGLGTRDRRLLLSERRPPGMQWGRFRPKSWS
jgi:Met-10+ like-protein